MASVKWLSWSSNIADKTACKVLGYHLNRPEDVNLSKKIIQPIASIKITISYKR